MNKESYRIRLATKADCPFLADVKLAAWETTYRGIYPDYKFDEYDKEKQTKKFEAFVDDPDNDLFVAESKNGKIVSYMSCGKPRYPYADYEQEIGMLYLLKECRGQGLGRRFFEKAVEQFKSRGYNRFFISCNKYNVPAQHFYLAMGGIIDAVDPDNEDHSVPQVKFVYKI